MPERSNGAVSKTVVGESPPRVRIPVSPPTAHEKALSKSGCAWILRRVQMLCGRAEHWPRRQEARKRSLRGGILWTWRVNWVDTSQRADAARDHRPDPARAARLRRRGPLARACAGQTAGRTFQATCDAALGNARCSVDLEDPAYKGAGAVIDMLRDRACTASGLGAFTSGCFTFGTLEWTSGANAGAAHRGAGT